MDKPLQVRPQIYFHRMIWDILVTTDGNRQGNSFVIAWLYQIEKQSEHTRPCNNPLPCQMKVKKNGLCLRIAVNPFSGVL